MAYTDDQVTQVHLHALRPGMRLTPLQSRPSQVTDAEIDHVIAKTLAESRQIEARAMLPDILHQDELTGLAGRNARSKAAKTGAAKARLSEVATRYAPESKPIETVEDLTGRALLRLRRPHPWVLRGALAALALVVVLLKPWGVVLVLLAAVIATLGLALAMGTDRMAGGLTRIYHWQNARNPGRAERFRARVDQLATGMDAALDRLPERWTVGLYMPDFSREALLENLEDDRPDPFDRIAAETRQL